jgi:hypothetical protein
MLLLITRGSPRVLTGSLPDDATERNRYPMADGLLDYFPNALAAISEVSRVGNEQHNPGQPMHHARGKSTDHANKVLRHLIDRGKKDSKGIRHSAYAAWRALALLQEEIEQQDGAPMPRNARLPMIEATEAEPAIAPGSADAAVAALLPPGPPNSHGED